MNRREPEGLGYAAYAYPNHPDRITHIPRTCKSRFRPVRVKVQVDKWVADTNRLFPNCPLEDADGNCRRKVTHI